MLQNWKAFCSHPVVFKMGSKTSLAIAAAAKEALYACLLKTEYDPAFATAVPRYIKELYRLLMTLKL
jgi:hypothetical protein